MLDEETIKALKIAFAGLQAPLGAASLANRFLANDIVLSEALGAAKRAFQKIPKGNMNYIPLENGIPGDMDRLFEQIDKIQWYVDNNQTPADCSLTQYLDDTKQLLDWIVRRIP